MSNRNKFNNKYSSLESSEDTKKYIKEMYEMADKNARMSNVIFTAVGIPILIIFALTIVQMFSFTVNLAKGNNADETQEIVSNINANTKDNASANSENSTSTPGTNEGTSSISSEKLNEKVYTYLNDSVNRQASFDKAKALNDGSDKGLATIFIAQILRDNEYAVPESVINTESLVKHLEQDGWEKITDYNKLEKGDVCFTIKSKSGAPSHTYIFMGWTTEGKTDSGQIVDNQISEYNSSLHERNISVATPKKDKFDFFMRKK